MSKKSFTSVVLVLGIVFSTVFFNACGVARDFTYIKQKTFGVSNVTNEEEFEKNIKVKSKKRKVNKVKVTQNVIYGPSIGYGSISLEERLEYSEKTDNDYGLFRYRFYYDYSTPDVIMIFIDEDSGFCFYSANDQSGREFKLAVGWPKDNLFNEYTTYRELYTLYLPLEYVEENKNKKGIVLDLISDEKGWGSNFGAALSSKKTNLSRTFHIPKFYINAFLNAIEKHRPKEVSNNLQK